MTLDEVKQYFGSSYQFHKKTKMGSSNYANWKKLGYIPIQSQARIQIITEGKLTVSVGYIDNLETNKVTFSDYYLLFSRVLKEATAQIRPDKHKQLVLEKIQNREFVTLLYELMRECDMDFKTTLGYIGDAILRFISILAQFDKEDSKGSKK